MVAAPSSSVSSRRPRRCRMPVGEDVAALEVAGELHLVDRHERHASASRAASPRPCRPKKRASMAETIFSSPVTSATLCIADLLDRRGHRPRAPGAAAAGRSRPSRARPCARSRRWVLPVLVGPSTAVTSRPVAISGPCGCGWIVMKGAGLQGLEAVATGLAWAGPISKARHGRDLSTCFAQPDRTTGTSPERNGGESLTLADSRSVPDQMWWLTLSFNTSP
jgi:hypothetical protein